MTGLSIGNPTVSVPYSSLKQSHVHVNGNEFLLKHPSQMSVEELVFIKDNIVQLSFIGRHFQCVLM